MSLLEFLCVFGLGIWTGRLYTVYQFRKILKKVSNDIGVNFDKELEKLQQKLNDDLEEIHTLETEQIENIIYLYYRNTKDFVCQGKSMDELAEFAQKYKNIKYANVLHGEHVYVFMNGKAKEYKENES